MKKLIGLDIGTTNIKADIYDIKGNLLDSASSPYKIYFGPGNLAEQDAEDWENISIKILNSIFGKYGDIAAIGLSTQGGTMLLTDGNCRPLRRAITWMDARGSSEKEDLLKKIPGEKIYNITGWKLQSILPLLQALWLKKNEPSVFKNAKKILFVADYMQQKLCGKSIADYSNASITMLFDVHKMDWSSELLDIANIEKEKLSLTGPSDTAIGFFNNKALLPSSRNVVFSNSGHDQYCVALSSDIKQDNKLMLFTGTSWTIFKSTEKPYFNKYYYSPGVHIIPGKYGLIGVIPTGGSVFNWFLTNFFGSDKDRAGFLKSADDNYLKVTSGKSNLLFIPLFNGIFGPLWNNDITGSMDNLTFDTDRSKIYKAVLEGMAFQLKWITQSLKEIDINFNGIKIIGGAARSRIQCKILADVTGQTVSRPRDLSLNYACRGAAMLAGVTAGIYKNFAAASLVFDEEEETIYPDLSMQDYYSSKFSSYMEKVKSKI